jgi:uncharacterized protein involved in outer membrane biogenesis
MRIFLRLIIILIVALCLAIGGLLMLPGDRIARIAEQQLTKQLGRPVTISSDTSVSFYPILGITTGGASIGTADWAKNGPLLETEQLAIGVDIPALIGGTIRITKLEATSPRVTLERAPDGRSNWDMFGSNGAGPTAQTQAQAPASQNTETDADADIAQSFDVSLQQALISDATLRYIDHGAGTDQTITDVDLDLRWPDLDGAADIKLGFTPFDDPIALTANVADILGFIGGAQTTLSGTIATAGATASFLGAASLAPTAALRVTVDAPNLGAVLKAAGQNPADLGLASPVDLAARFASDVSFDGSRLALRNMNATADQSKLAGAADIILTQAVPDITAKLTADIRGTANLMRRAGQAPEKFGLDPAFDPAATSQIDLTMAGGNVTAKLRELTLRLEDTTAKGSLDLQINNGTPTVAVDLNANVPNVARTAALAGQPLSALGLAPSAVPSFSGRITGGLTGGDLNATLNEFAASLAGATATGDLSITTSGGAQRISGTLSANVPSTANLMTALGQSATNIPKGFGQSIKASTKITLKDQRLDLGNLSLALDQNTLSGAVALDLNGNVPKVTANLQAGALDFSALAPDDNAAEPVPSKPDQGWSKDPIDASALGLLNGDIKLHAASIDLGKIKLGATDTGITIDRARAVFNINNLQAYQGAVAGQFVANNRNGLSVGGNLKVNAIALEPLLAAVADIDKIAGSGTMDLQFLGVGNTMDAIMRSLSGNLALSVPSGSIGGLDLEGLILQGDASATRTTFSNLKATSAIAGGVAINTDLSIVTGRVDAKGQGQINLGAQTLDYLFTPIAKDVGDRRKISVPVRIKGPWSGPTIRPDLEAAFKLEADREKAILEKRLKEEEQKLRDRLEAEKQNLANQARAAAEQAARDAAQRAAEKLNIDTNTTKALEDAARKALENQAGNVLRGLLGGN